jgi:RHS repeat-associated protein
LKQATPYGSGSSEWSYYDGVGRLFKWKATSGTVSYYLYSGSELLTERQGSYTANERLRLGGISQWIGYPSSGHDTLTYSYALYDPMGNVCVVTNYNATSVTNSDTAGEYGTGPTQPNEQNWQGGSGYQYRSGTGIYQVGARTYDPQSGRFLQEDPSMEGMGDYTYANNNPANFTDPTGLISIQQTPCLLWAGSKALAIGTTIGKMVNMILNIPALRAAFTDGAIMVGAGLTAPLGIPGAGAIIGGIVANAVITGAGKAVGTLITGALGRQFAAECTSSGGPSSPRYLPVPNVPYNGPIPNAPGSDPIGSPGQASVGGVILGV